MLEKLVIATRNRGKVAEISRILRIPGLELLTLDDFGDFPEVVEDGATFEDNAVKKAKALFAYAGLPALADDSGLEVDALNGRPGVLSARYGGEGAGDADRNALLLREMAHVPEGHRSARFICVMALALTGGRILTARGACEGAIAYAPRGAGGFGYDPVFLVQGTDLTMAELEPGSKDRVSHRGAALREIRALIRPLADAR